MSGAVATPFIHRVRIRNFKSIQACDVRLGPLTFLVGPNGAGKSNFLDALRFVADGLTVTLEYALRERSGINEVRRRSAGHPTHFGIRLDFVLPSGASGRYAFEIASQKGGGFKVQTEECAVAPVAVGGGGAWFRVSRGRVETDLEYRLPEPAGDRLYLQAASAAEPFRSVLDALTAMGFYNLNPEVIRDLQAPDTGGLLQREGSNLASVLGQIESRDPAAKARIEEYLSKVVPGIRGVRRVEIAKHETLQFRQQVVGVKDPWKFPAVSMSDGTLRALGVLVALLQPGNGGGARPTLVGIEEPEVALHPAAVGVLLDALREGSRGVQVVVTSHSPDLLDDDSIPTDAVLAVVAEDGRTEIGPIDGAGRKVLHEHLFTAGELLRLDQLRPSDEARQIAASEQLRLFGE